ncbi:MAG: DUF4123 domain-containing protein [Rubrivivax sp.]|nr:MAG: DUF4123 domain-containing protein [Rubrivivax sp.]
MQALLAERGGNGLAVCGQSMMSPDLTDVNTGFEQLSQAVQSDPSAKLFALVDGALLLDLPKKCQQRWRASHGVSLLTGARGHGAAEVGPLLYELPSQPMNSDLCSSLLDLTSGKSAGSFIVSRLNLNDLAVSLARFVDVTLSDQSTMVMRFFDPRVLPFWFQAIKPRYQFALAECIAHWFHWDHRQVFENIPLTTAAQANEFASFPTHLSAAEEAQLMSACYPFTLIERFRIEDSAALSKVPVHRQYEFFSGQIDRAAGHGITDHLDLEIYCTFGLEVGERFDEHVAILPALSMVKSGERFSKAMSTLDIDWNQLKTVNDD